MVGAMTGQRSIVAALLALAASAGGACAAPLDDRNAAFRVISEAARVERAFSNCRWIRGRPADALLAGWRRDNRELLDAGLAVPAAQGGYTGERRRVAEELVAHEADPSSSSRAACEAFHAEVRSGGHDLGTRIPAALLRQVLAYAPPAGVPVLWRVDLRRGPDGVLRSRAVRSEADGVRACDADEGAGRGHIHLLAASGQPPADPDLWFSECMESPVDPVDGRGPGQADASAGAAP